MHTSFPRPPMAVNLILASASPRRRQMLEALPWRVEIRPAAVDETQGQTESGPELVRRLAALKALTVFSTLAPAEKQTLAGQTLIVGADTVVVYEERILGKPENDVQAAEFLRLLRQGSHEVHSGICIVDARTGQTCADAHCSRLSLRNYTDTEIAAYIAGGSPLDKAGAYALQDLEFRPVAELEGCAASVMGFPLGRFADICQAEFGCALPGHFPVLCTSVTGYPCCRERAVPCLEG